MNELNDNTAYKQFTVLVPLDDVYIAHMPRDRNLVLLWLSGMVSPYSIALGIIDIRMKTQQDGGAELWESLEWLPDVNERTIANKYISSLVVALELYVLPILHQEALSLDNTSLAFANETTIDEWSCGYVTLTFNVHRQGEARRLVGTPYPIRPNGNQQPVPIANIPQVPVNNFYNGY